MATVTFFHAHPDDEAIATAKALPWESVSRILSPD